MATRARRLEISIDVHNVHNVHNVHAPLLLSSLVAAIVQRFFDVSIFLIFCRGRFHHHGGNQYPNRQRYPGRDGIPDWFSFLRCAAGNRMKRSPAHDPYILRKPGMPHECSRDCAPPVKLESACVNLFELRRSVVEGSAEGCRRNLFYPPLKLIRF
jgi:hypothetical protein